MSTLSAGTINFAIPPTWRSMNRRNWSGLLPWAPADSAETGAVSSTANCGSPSRSSFDDTQEMRTRLVSIPADRLQIFDVMARTSWQRYEHLAALLRYVPSPRDTWAAVLPGNRRMV